MPKKKLESPHVSVVVWGEYALFTRPEFKVERVSYPVITPSAARGILEAIYWKPEFAYRICKIDVLKPGTQVSILRTEVTERAGGKPIVVQTQHTQRSSLMLKNVAYALHADLKLRPHADKKLPAYVSQFERTVKRGRCFHRPYLGTRECGATFEPYDPEWHQPEEDFNLNIGTMLLDQAYVRDEEHHHLTFRYHGEQESHAVSGYKSPVYFQAEVKKGVLTVRSEDYNELDRLERHVS